MTIKVCLDAGHYGKNYNQSPANKSYYESNAMWKLHLYLKKYLEEYGIEVIQTRSNQNADLALYERGAKSKGCNLFLSLHSNAVGDSKVNESVDYPIAYVPIDGKGDKIGDLLSKCVANTMVTKQAPRYASQRGSNGDYFGVIRGATAVGTPGIILEHSFHTNTKSTNWLSQDSNLDKMAKNEAMVIAQYFGVEKPSDVIFRVQVGAFSNRSYADAYLEKVKAAGFKDAFIAVSNGK